MKDLKKNSIKNSDYSNKNIVTKKTMKNLIVTTKELVESMQNFKLKTRMHWNQFNYSIFDDGPVDLAFGLQTKVCWFQYGNYYSSEIIACTKNRRVLVEFLGYGEYELLKRDNLIKNEKAKSTSLDKN